MSSCFGKYGISNLTNFDFTASDYTKKIKYDNVYCTLKNEIDGNGDYSDTTFKINDGKLTYVASNEDHINLAKAQYYQYYNNDCSFAYDLMEMEFIDHDCVFIDSSNIGISNEYTGFDPSNNPEQANSILDVSATEYAQIYDVSISALDISFEDIEKSLQEKVPKMQFPVSIRFNNVCC